LITIKVLVDFTVLKTAAGFFRKNLDIPSFLLGIYAYAIVICVVAIGSLRGNYTWKGRTFEKPR
jgi:hypothetical protein